MNDHFNECLTGVLISKIFVCKNIGFCIQTIDFVQVLNSLPCFAVSYSLLKNLTVMDKI